MNDRSHLRLAHCSDIHLDGDDRPADHYKDAFARTLGAIAGHEPDVMLLAGDLFDANDASTATIEWVMDLLSRQRFPVVMIPGNHDCLGGDAIYHRHDFNAIGNVDLLLAEQGQLVTMDTLQLAVWGKGLVDHTPRHRPLAGCPARPPGVRWYVGMGHGIYVAEGSETDRSSPVHANEIANSACDYIALGHHHAALEVHEERTAAAYCGSPTDRVGGSATYAVVDLPTTGYPRVVIHSLP